MSSSPILLRQFELGLLQNFVYFIGDPGSKEVFVVDPAWEVDTILKKEADEGLKIVGALVTHYHFDHTNGIEDLLKHRDIPVYMNKADVPYLDFKSSNIKEVSGSDKVCCGKVEVEMIHTPGHTPGSQCFKVQDNLVSGDTLFIGACGRCDLPGGDPAEMYRSLTQRLGKLPDSTILFPGHNYADAETSTMGDQRKTNPYLLCETLDHFLNFRSV